MFWVLLVLFGAAGVVARFLIGQSFQNVSFPYATIVVNVVGSFLAGMLLGFKGVDALSSPVYLAILIGFLGALTTFSSYSLDVLRLLSSGSYMLAGLNIALNNGLAITACLFGYWILNRPL